jgi:hypothetical protein
VVGQNAINLGRAVRVEPALWSDNDDSASLT